MADVVRRDRAYYKSPEYKRECRRRKAEREGRRFQPGVPGRAAAPRQESPAKAARAAWAEWLGSRAPEWWLNRYHQVRAQVRRAAEQAKSRRRYERNTASERQRVRAYKDANPGRVSKWHKTRQARMVQQGVEPLSNRVISKLYNRANCPYCGDSLELGCVELDHIIPLAGGGRHEARNLVACCSSCNRRKGARSFSEWLTMCPAPRRAAATRLFMRRFGVVTVAEVVAHTT